MATRNEIEVLAIVLLAILCSPIDAQEFHRTYYDAQDDLHPPLGIIPIRRAWSHWRSGLGHLALVNQKVRMIQVHRQVRAMMHATVLWRITAGHRSALQLYRDVRWQRPRFYRLWLSEMVDNWNLNSKEDPIREALSWKDQSPCDRILEIMQKNSSGQRGNPGKEVFFVDKDGCRIRMALKLFKADDNAGQHIDDFKEKAPKKSAREKLDSLLKNKSVARFRSLASSSDQSASSEAGSDYSLSLQGEPEDKLALLIEEKLGSESLAPKFRKSVERKQKEGSSQQRAVSQLQQQLDLLKKHEADAMNTEHRNQSAAEWIKKTEKNVAKYNEQVQQRQAADELEALKALRMGYEDKPLAEAMEEANVSSDLRQMFDQSQAIKQSDVQQKILIGRLNAMEKGLADMTAMNKSLLDSKHQRRTFANMQTKQK